MPATLTATARTLARLGRPENEDSFAIRPRAGRFAVADGAGTSARPEVWSRLLVTAFVYEGIDPLAPENLRALRERWWRAVDRPSLPWFAQAKLQSGADASFVGLHVDPAEHRWSATAVGDACVFQLRAGRLCTAGPVRRAADFARFAELVSSRPGAPVEPTVLTGGYRPGDILVLATDAFAQFLLRAHENHGRIPPPTWLAHSADRFARLVAAYRHHGCLANDDTTICVVRT